MRGLVLLLLVMASLGGVQGCSHPARTGAVPSELTAEAEVVGMPGIRYWFDGDLQPVITDGIAAFKRTAAHKGIDPRKTPLDVDILAISGGGDNGAFGAGLIVGWGESGMRPEFRVVTGVSTGALTAPFAFLGGEYDAALNEVYTTITPADVIAERPITAAVFDDAMTDNAPLMKMVSRYATEDMLTAIAHEWEAKGRYLLIGTTDLDARRSVIWNIGKLAASGHPDSLMLFRRILVASAAIPGIFPPIMVDVEAGGQRYQEMHVDGGAMSQVFVYPPSLSTKKIIQQHGLKRGKRTLYIIRNARLDADWASTERRTLDIAGRAISSLIHTQGIGDLYQIHMIAERDDVDYNLAYIGADFEAVHREEFDPVFMNELFEYGYELGLKGYPWKKLPPGFEVAIE